MIGYVCLGTNDLPRATAFYDALLGEVGIGRLMAFGERGHGWARRIDKPMLCVFKPYDGKPATVGNGVMVGLAVASRDEVDRLHRKALELGGSDEGPPGPRAAGGDGFYAAYFRDLDGNKLDVFCYG
jgi:catechol 2,3-dioxygenase-like lactoylglutathione lyase family enzyme